MNKIDSENNFDTNILPTELKMTLGIVCIGTKTAVHDKIIENSLAVFEKLEESNDWRTIKGLATGVLVEDFNIYPEQKGKSLLTTAVFDLRIGLPDLSKELEEEKLNVKLNVLNSEE